ncbi:hypothetical protein V5O48_008646 [Marasmius crinis-equi]|uniref:Brl1/Brr6 domain-containing protein n=1 Tax=Marasmius crinis-equi TaxID=585013 RepID=A0ABR3FDV0_9AGAR
MPMAILKSQPKEEQDNKLSYIEAPDGFRFTTAVKRPRHLNTDLVSPGGFRPFNDIPYYRSATPGQPIQFQATSTSTSVLYQSVFTARTLATVAVVFSVCLVGWLLAGDVMHSIDELGKDVRLQAEACLRRYTENACDTPVEAMESACRAWKICKDRDPSNVGSSMIVAHTLGAFIDNFASAVSLKTFVGRFYIFTFQPMIYLYGLGDGTKLHPRLDCTSRL